VKRPLQLLVEGALSDVRKAAVELGQLGWAVSVDVSGADETSAQVSLTIQLEQPQRPTRLPLDPLAVAGAGGADLEQPLNDGRVVSMFGGVDRGAEGDAPSVGRTVAYQVSDGVFAPAVVLAIRDDGWTISLRRFDTNDVEEFVPYGGGREFGRLPTQTWVTLDEYEGWKIYESERKEA
jgi:hypothetical protein